MFAEKNLGFGGGRTRIMVMILRVEVKNNISGSMVWLHQSINMRR
jgi:hypothetical protein